MLNLHSKEKKCFLIFLTKIVFFHQDLKALLDASNEGVIYWSFGSMARIETIPTETLTQIFEALSRLSQIVLIKMNRGMLSRNITVPDNVYAMDWIPQYATLRKYEYTISHTFIIIIIG